ncbi:Npt1/Npt2 family nucleotide transporter [Paenibacillus sp. YYML68]|uniref:Npt1/Npt2 family nucleotide transporter n=1 Tax=Paenibacillus sp. YYML68 TaxID=2909250 RepID=UPI0024935A41|nr:Npt1/Npt2 family nucleotide transporter [Paenibacillus sp. YYML68]
MLKTVQADRDELTKAMLLCCYLFSVTAASTVGRTAADTLFLSRFDHASLSAMYLPQALMMIAAGFVFQRVTAKVRVEALLPWLIPCIAALVLAGRLAAGFELRWSFPVLYIAVDVFNFLMIVCFWQLATGIMDQRKAKRMIGFVGAGGIAGAITSGFGMKAILPLIGTANLLLVYAAFQLLALLLMLVLRARGARARSYEADAGRASASSVQSVKPKSRSKQEMLSQAPHLRAFAVLSAALIIALTLIDYQFKAIIREELQNDALASFMGSFYGLSGIVALLVQLLVSGWVLSRFGMMTALLVFPVLLLVGSSGLLLLPVLTVAVLVKGSDKVVGDTIHSSVNQLIMFPIAPEWRGPAKGWMDGVVRNGAKGLAALVLLATGSLLAPAQLSYIVLLLLVIAIAAGLRVKPAYMKTLTASLARGTPEDDSESSPLMLDASARKLLLAALYSEEPQQAMAAYRMLRHVSFSFTPHIPELLIHPVEGIRLEALKLAAQAADPSLLPAIIRCLDSEQPTAVRAAAIHALAVYEREEDLERVSEYVSSSDLTLQTAAIVALVKQFGIEGMFRAVSRLKELIDSRIEAERLCAAAIIGQIGVRSFYKPLAELLTDASPQVRIRAIEAAGALRAPALLQPLLARLQDYETRRYAIEALAVYPEDELLPMLEQALTDTTNALHIPLVCAKVGTPSSWMLLLNAYEGAELELRDRLLEAMLRGMEAAPGHVEAQLEQYALAELALDTELAKQQMVLSMQLSEHSIVHELLSDTRESIRRRVFQLLALHVKSRTLVHAHQSWTTGDVRQQANAVELVDQSLKGQLRQHVTRWMNGWSAAQEATHASVSASDALMKLRKLPDPMLRAAIEAELASLQAVSASEALDADATHRARWESIRLLKQTPLFRELTVKDRARIAERLVPVQYEPGATLVEQGEVGECLYLITDGETAIVRDGRQVSSLRAGDCLGEMALFIQGKRTATAVATTRMQALRLDAEELLSIFDQHSFVAMDMMKLLSRRLRDALSRRPKQEDSTADSATQPVGAAGAAVDAMRREHAPLASMEHDGAIRALLRRIAALERIELFAQLPPDDMLWLARSLHESTWAAGTAICKEGEHGDVMYAILEGSVRVHRGTDTIAMLQQDEYFGELAVIDSAPRSAHCTAETDTVLLELPRDLIVASCAQNRNVLRSILQVLATRLQRV